MRKQSDYSLAYFRGAYYIYAQGHMIGCPQGYTRSGAAEWLREHGAVHQSYAVAAGRRIYL